MLKVRVVGVLIVKGGIVVQSIGFKKYLPVGMPPIAIEYLNQWGIDEIVLLDIDATPQNRDPQIDQIRAYSQFCQVPLTVGGGIKHVSQIKNIIQAGADKVVMNTEAINNPNIITEGAKLFGSQCIVVSIDAKRMTFDQYEVFTHSGMVPTGKTPVELAIQAEKYGAGEIFINSIDRDGSKKGYDLELIQLVVSAVRIPVIACGGVNHPEHMVEAIPLDVGAVAAANFFHYSEQSVTTVKSYIEAHNQQIRLDSYATYRGNDYDERGRVAKKDDAYLDQLRFEYIPEEVI